MTNPFETIENRLSRIEAILGEIKQAAGQPGQSTDDDILDVSEAAQLLNLRRNTVYIKCSKNELPVMKIGNRLHFSRKELMEHIRTGRRKTIYEISGIKP